MTTQEDRDEIESLGLHGPTPLRVQDPPVPAEEIRSWMKLYRPAGFREVSVANLAVLPAAVTHLGGTLDDAMFLVPYDRLPAEADMSGSLFLEAMVGLHVICGPWPP